MAGQKRFQAHHLFAKTWPEVFSEDRHFKEDTPRVNEKRGLGTRGNDITLVTQESEDDEHSPHVRDLETFCRDAQLADVRHGKGDAGQLQTAWVNDTTFDQQICETRSREYPDRMTATGVFRALSERRYDHTSLPDADRRLVYIEGLNPHYILALGHTAPNHQMPVLRNAFHMHITSQTSISINIPPRGFPIFQMEMHIPCFELRKSSTTAVDQTRDFIDVSFLHCGATDLQGNNDYRIYNKRFSFVICGSDHRRWTGYAFAESEPDQKVEEHSEDDGQEDLIASGSDAYGTPFFVHPGNPLYDPREYFLVVLEIRMAGALKDWKTLVRWVASSIEDQEGYHTFNLARKAPAFRGPRDENPKQAFDRVRQTLKLLRQLLGRLSKTIKALEKFNSENGDINYFSGLASSGLDTQQRLAHGSTHAIHVIFKELELLQEDLIDIKETCGDSLTALQVRNMVESNEAAQQSGFNTRFTTGIMAPLALAVACFSMNKSVIPFPISFKSFLAVTVGIFIMSNLLSIVLRLIWRWDWFGAGLGAMRLDWLTVNGSCAIAGMQCLPGRKRGRKGADQIGETELNDMDTV